MFSELLTIYYHSTSQFIKMLEVQLMIEYTGQMITYVENANEIVATAGGKVVMLVLILNSISDSICTLVLI